MISPAAPSGYAPMPGEPAPGPVSAGPAPSSVVNAVRLMFVNVALGVLGLIVLFATKDTLKKDILKHHHSYSASKLDDTVNSAVAIGVVIGIIFIVLYVLLALQVGKGKNWARIVTWVLAGLGVLSTAEFAGPARAGGQPGRGHHRRHHRPRDHRLPGPAPQQRVLPQGGLIDRGVPRERSARRRHD